MIRYLADFATPLHATVHQTPFQWTSTEEKAYDALKVMLTQATVIQPPVWVKPFHVFVDASDIKIGSALMQLTEPNWYRPVYYASRKLSTAERNYSTTEREALGMIYNINKFQHYLLGRKFTFHVDHSALLYLVEKQALTGKLARWMLLLQEFDFVIQHRPSTQHVVADFLSRLNNGEMAQRDDDDFPDVDILRVAMLAERTEKTFPDQWLMEMTYFLTTGLLPPQLQTDVEKTVGRPESKFLFSGRHIIPQGQ